MDGVQETCSGDVFLEAREQKFDEVASLCQANPELWTAVDAEGHGLVHWAALTGDLDFVNRCLEHGVVVDLLAEKTQQTAFMWAILRGHIPVAKRLLDAGADMYLQDSVGASTAILAIQHHQYWSLLLLVRQSQGNTRNVLELRDQNGCTAAHWAAFKGDATSLRRTETLYPASRHVFHVCEILGQRALRGLCCHSESLVVWLVAWACMPHQLGPDCHPESQQKVTFPPTQKHHANNYTPPFPLQHSLPEDTCWIRMTIDISHRQCAQP